MLAQKVGLSLLIALVAVIVALVTAFSFGLGQRAQNLVMIVDVVVSVLWLWFVWRGKWRTALLGVGITFVVGVFVVPLLSK